MRWISEVIATVLLSVCTGRVQMQVPVRTPAPELAKLNYLAGSWSIEVASKTGTIDAGSKRTMTTQNSWMDGHFFLVMRSTYLGSGGSSGSSFGFMGFDKDAGIYTYDEFDSTGDIDHSKGTIQGDTWLWTNEGRRLGETYKGRFTMKVVSPNSYTFKYEISTDGKTWTTTVDGSAVRSR
jgi:hypothetical protein